MSLILSRRAVRWASSPVTALVLALSLLLAAAVAARADDPPATTTQISSGALNWGIKSSFRRYVGDGGITVAGGVTRTDDATDEFPVKGFTWPLQSGTFDAATKSTVLQFGGSVRFLAHDGALDMTIAAPKLVLSGTESTLYAEVRSKPFSGGDVVDYGVVPVVSLDLSGKDPAVTSTTTTWPALTSYLTAAAGPAFAGFYSVATEMDPVSTTYTGPGAKAPVTAEAWDAPGTAKYTKLLVNAGVHPTSVYPDLARHVLVVVEQGGAIRALDPDTLQPTGSAAPVTRQENITNSHSAYDTRNGTLFVVVGARVHALTWNAGSSSFDDAVLPGADLGSDYSADLGYNAKAGLLVHFAGDTVQTWKRDGSSWTRKDYEGVDANSYLSRIAVDDDGSVLVATASSTPHQIDFYPDEDFAAAYALPDSYTDPQASQPGQYDGPSQIVIGPDGTATFASYTGRIWTARKGSDGVYAQVGPSVAQTTGNVFDSAVDPTDGTVLLAVQGANRILAYRDGAAAGFTAVPVIGFPNNFPYPYMGLAADSDHNVYVNSSDATQGGLWKLKRLGLTPTVTTQPRDATTTLGLGVASKDITFTAAATGTPAPALQWQTRAGSSDRWSDVAGATGGALTVTATVAKSGLQVRAVATNAAGAIATGAATLDVQAAPAIVVQPDPQSTVAGTATTFNVAPSGNPYPSVQWQRLDASGFWVNVEDATSGVFTLDDPSPAMDGTTLRARIRNTYGTVYSRAVTLSVRAPVTGPVGVTGGYLDWGVKASFRTYVRGPIAAGDYVASGGASENADGTLRFTALSGSYDATNGKTTVRLGGSVRFTGHAGALDMTFGALRVELDGTGGGTLYADAVSKPNEPGASAQTHTGVALAALDPGAARLARGDGTVAWTGIGATLTAAGAPAFAGFYSTGQVLDAANLALTVGGPVTGDDGGRGDTPPATGTDTAAPAAATPVAAPVAPPAAALTAAGPPVARTARRPTVHTAGGRVRVGRTRTVTVATLRCLDGPCRIKTTRTVSARFGGRTSKLSILALGTLKTGKTGSLKIKLSASVYKRLKGHTATLAIKVTATAGGRTTSVTIHPKITA
jgi:hypothetical protein